MYEHHQSGWQKAAAPTSEKEALNLVSKESAYKARLVPLRMEGRVLTCLASDPIDPYQIRKLEMEICREINLITAAPGFVQTALELAYGPADHLDAHEIVDAISRTAKKPNANVDLSDVPRRNPGPMKVIAISSGKGGVGKSSVTASIGVALADFGYRVGMIDCDFGLSNLHILFGARPEFNLSDVISGRTRIAAAFAPVHRGLSLLAGHAGASEYADIDYAALQNANAGFSELHSAYDYLLLDTGAGVHQGVLSLMMAADEVVLVTTPDPSAVLDAYVAARTLLNRRPSTIIRCLANNVRSDSEAKEIYAKFMTFIGLNTSGRAEFLGKVQNDRSVVEAGRTKRPVLLYAPKSQAARDMQVAACRLARIPVPAHLEAGPMGRWFGKLAA
jgi:flagellar biosynthesis protein FlhG